MLEIFPLVYSPHQSRLKFLLSYNHWQSWQTNLSFQSVHMVFLLLLLALRLKQLYSLHLLQLKNDVQLQLPCFLFVFHQLFFTSGPVEKSRLAVDLQY